MGYIKHTAIVLTSWSSDHMTLAIDKAKALELEVSEPVMSRVSGYRTVMIAPHGSKGGWTDQEEGDKAREEFIAWIKSGKLYIDWFAADYGEDHGEAEIIDSSWTEG